MNRQLLILPLVMLLSLRTYAEPSKTVTFLGNDPVSMWDFGFYQLNNDLRSIDLLPDMAKKMRAVAIYDPKANRIVILASSPFDMSSPSLAYTAPNAGKGKTHCNDLINSVRHSLGAKDQQYTRITGRRGYVCRYFEHTDFRSTNEPVSFCEELESIVTITAVVQIKGRGNLRCNGGLVGEVVYFSE